MLSSAVRSQLARVNCSKELQGVRFMMEVNLQPPMAVTLDETANSMKYLPPKVKHWFLGGPRSFTVGLKLLQERNIIAVPTDTIYGLATLAQDEECVNKLYKLKGRDLKKPFAICVSSISDIPKWAVTNHLPEHLLMSLLPGPITVVLERKPSLNPMLNPEYNTIGIRVPTTKFLRSVCKILNQPLALTSANSSGEQSTLTPEEFRHLWPELGGIFYSIIEKSRLDDSYRAGSTIVDLSKPGEFEIIREGISFERVMKFMYKYGLNKKSS